MFEKFCHQCSAPIPAGADYPYTCVCGFQIFSNPIPVVVGIVPVEGGGLLGVRRAIAPLGPALPGGFLEEEWRVGMCRELYEETGLVCEEGVQIQLFNMLSTPDEKRLLIFGLFPQISKQEFSELHVNDSENSEIVLLVDDGQEHGVPINQIVFPMHQKVARLALHKVFGK